MDRLVRKIEIPIARNKIQKAGLYLVPEQRLDELTEIAADAYQKLQEEKTIPGSPVMHYAMVRNPD